MVPAFGPVFLFESFHPGHFILFEGVLLAVVAAIVIFTRQHKGATWSEPASLAWDIIPGAEMDEAERGDRVKSLQSLAEAVPPELEKRAILHKRWMMVAHATQFPEPGSYRTYTIASIPFFVIRSRDSVLRAFHNVCRHRAYTVVRKPCGKSLRLNCKYHGWQYDTTGKLVKAPQFLDGPAMVEGFDAKDNGLFEIHLKVDSGRFVFVNLATEIGDAFSWSDSPTSALKTLDFGEGKGAVEWEVEVSMGWIMASLLPFSFNAANLVTKSWKDSLRLTIRGSSGHQQPYLQYIDDASFMCTLGDGSRLLISALPMVGRKTLFRCTYIPNQRNLPNMAFISNKQIQHRADAEILSAVERLKHFRAATTNLGFRESAVRERWDKLARLIDQHRRMEKKTGKKINPASRVTGREAADVEAEALCNTLDGVGDRGEVALVCGVGMEKELEW